jgi:hypothetical protein
VPLKLFQQLGGLEADRDRQVLGIVELRPIALGDERGDSSAEVGKGG